MMNGTEPYMSNWNKNWGVDSSHVGGGNSSYSYNRESSSQRYGRAGSNMYSSYGAQSLTGSPAPLLSSRRNYSNNATSYSNNTSNYSNNASNYSNNASKYSNNASKYSNNASNYSNNASNYSNNASNYSNNASKYSNYSNNASKYSKYSNNASNYSTNASNWASLNQSVRQPYYGAGPSPNRYKRTTPLLQSQPLYQGSYYNSPRNHYEDDYDSYNQSHSLLGERPTMNNYGPSQQDFSMPWMERNQMVLGYLGLHNLRKGKSGLYTINQLNYLLRSKLRYDGPPVMFNARLNENNIEVIFPSMDTLRATVEKLSPFTMKGNLTIYVTYKPPTNVPVSRNFQYLGRNNTMRAPLMRSGKPLSHLVSRVRRGPTPVSGKMALSPSKAQQLRKNKQNLPRLRGVFPDGVQPRQVTLVVDTSSPFTSLASLKGSGHQLIVGNNLDMAAFLSLIRGNFSTDGVLYVVMPSLALLLNNLDAFSMNTSSEDETVDQPEQNGGPAIQQNGTDQQNGSAQQNGVAQKPVQANNKAGRSKKRSLLQEVLTDFLPLISALDVELLGKPVASSGKTVPDDRSALARLLARHLLHSAVALRASVRASTNNCELVFCGYPVHHLDQGRLEAALSTTLSPPRAQRVASALVFALRVFNDFAVNSWMLGGFKINSFNDANLPDPSSAPAVAAEDQTPVGQSVEAVAGLLESLTVDQQQQPGAVISLSSLASLDWFDEAADKEAVRTGYTANVLTAVQKVCNFQLHKGGFVPWGPVEAEPIEDDFVPDIVKESVKCKIYTEQVDAATNKTLYHCNECSQLLGDIAAADSHAYTRRHFYKARRFVQLRAKQDGQKKSVLVGTSIQPVKTVPLAADYVTKMINFKVVSKTETSLGNSYQCLVCEISRDNSFDDTALRFHVHHHRHRLNVINLFGLKSHRAMVSQHENWQLVQSLLRHPSLDVVVLADDRHRSTLQRISAANDQVHLVTLPELLQAEQSASIAASALAEGQRATEGRPALWFIVSGADLLCRADQNQDAAENVEKLEAPVLSLLASLRALLPVSQRVVLAPLLPLYLLSDSLPHASTAQLLANTNALTAPQPQLPAFAILYRALHKRLQALHAATALQANVPAIHANVLRRDPVISVTNASGVPCLVATPWHVALQPLVTAATVALPSLYLMPSCEPLVDELELDARVQHVALVGENIHVKKATRFGSNKQLVFERKLCFDQDDIDFISAKAELCEEGSFTVWYLACPLPATLFDRSDSNCCQAAQCSSPLSSFSPRGEDSVSEALLKISKFVTKLQSVLPSGNIVSLMPVFPSSVVSYSSTDAVTHAALHSLSQSLPSMSFSQESPQALNKVLASFRDGWTDLFSKTSLHYKMRGDRNHLVQAQALEINAAVSDLKEEMKGQAQDWLASVNALLRNHSNRLMVLLADTTAQQLGLNNKEDEATPAPAKV